MAKSKDIKDTVQVRSKGLSYSQLSKFYQCEMAWYIAYVKRVRIPGGEAMFIGSMFHALLEHSYLQGKALSLPKVNAIYKKILEEEYQDSTFDAVHALERVVALYRRYCSYYPGDFEIDVVAVEDQRFDGTISGVADLLYRTPKKLLVLREHKTKSRLESQPADYQRDFYSRLWPEIDMVEYNMANTYDYKNEPDSLAKVFIRSPTFSTQENQDRLQYAIDHALERMEELRSLDAEPHCAFFYNTCKYCDGKAECPAQIGLTMGGGE